MKMMRRLSAIVGVTIGSRVGAIEQGLAKAGHRFEAGVGLASAQAVLIGQ